LLIKIGHVSLCGGRFIATHGSHVGVRVRGHEIGLFQVGFALQKAVVCIGNALRISMFTGEATKTVHVGHHVGCAQQRIELLQAEAMAF
jgi:hypothetical protein